MKLNDLIKKLDIDETYTKPIKRPKRFTKVKDNIPLVDNYNFMADLLFLPTDKKGFKYLLVLVDLANDSFDIEPIKNKDAETVLDAMKAMFKRKYIKKPYASIRTDDGKEFKGVFAKYLYNNDILHKTALPQRHTQLSSIDSLCYQLGRIFNGYMNSKEIETKKVYREWTDILDTVRKDGNKIRAKTLPEDYQTHNYPVFHSKKESKYKKGDIVYRALEVPNNSLGNKQSTTQFRAGDYRFDLVPKKVLQVLYYAGYEPYRYIIEGFPNVSYTEKQLLAAKEAEQKFIVKQLIDKKVVKKKVYYLVWWRGEKKAQASWEPANELIKDGLKDMIDDYENEMNDLDLELEFQNNL